MKVGVVPNSNDFSHPQDRRRYLPFLKRRNIKFELANFEKIYDVLYISLACDLHLWSSYKQRQGFEKCRLIFDCSDNYLVCGPINSFLRAVFHFLSGRSSTLNLDYRQTIRKMLAGCDVVTVGSIEQREHLKNYTTAEIVITHDCFEEFDKCGWSPSVHGNTVTNRSLEILWEGFPHLLFEISGQISRFLNDLSLETERKIIFNVVTDAQMCRFGGRFFCRNVHNYLSSKLESANIQVRVFSWEAVTLKELSRRCRFAIIPIPSRNIFARSKPENKVLLFWKLGLPVLATGIPSYRRVFESISAENLICDNKWDWVNAATFLLDEENCATIRKRAIEYVETVSSDSIYLETWSKIFDLKSD